MEIADWRTKIDEMDEQIVELIGKRAEAAKASLSPDPSNSRPSRPISECRRRTRASCIAPVLD